MIRFGGVGRACSFIFSAYYFSAKKRENFFLNSIRQTPLVFTCIKIQTKQFCGERDADGGVTIIILSLSIRRSAYL